MAAIDVSSVSSSTSISCESLREGPELVRKRSRRDASRQEQARGSSSALHSDLRRPAKWELVSVAADALEGRVRDMVLPLQLRNRSVEFADDGGREQ